MTAEQCFKEAETSRNARKSSGKDESYTNEVLWDLSTVLWTIAGMLATIEMDLRPGEPK